MQTPTPTPIIRDGQPHYNVGDVVAYTRHDREGFIGKARRLSVRFVGDGKELALEASHLATVLQSYTDGRGRYDREAVQHLLSLLGGTPDNSADEKPDNPTPTPDKKRINPLSSTDKSADKAAKSSAQAIGERLDFIGDVIEAVLSSKAFLFFCALALIALQSLLHAAVWQPERPGTHILEAFGLTLLVQLIVLLMTVHAERLSKSRWTYRIMLGAYVLYDFGMNAVAFFQSADLSAYGGYVVYRGQWVKATWHDQFRLTLSLILRFLVAAALSGGTAFFAVLLRTFRKK